MHDRFFNLFLYQALFCLVLGVYQMQRGQIEMAAGAGVAALLFFGCALILDRRSKAVEKAKQESQLGRAREVVRRSDEFRTPEMEDLANRLAGAGFEDSEIRSIMFAIGSVAFTPKDSLIERAKAVQIDPKIGLEARRVCGELFGIDADAIIATIEGPSDAG